MNGVMNGVMNSVVGNAANPFPNYDIGKGDGGDNKGQLNGRSLEKTSFTPECIAGKLDDEQQKLRTLAQRECDHHGVTPLLIADTQRSTDYLQMLNEAGGDISNVVTTAFQGGATELFELLECLKNARLSQTTLDNALCEAAKQGQIQCLDILTTAGAKDLNGALYSAVLTKNIEVQKALIFKGANISSLVRTAASKDSLEYLDDQIISKYINSPDENGKTPLHIAAGMGHIKSLKKLIETDGVNINITDNYDWTPLHLAVRFAGKETAKAVELLLNSSYAADNSLSCLNEAFSPAI